MELPQTVQTQMSAGLQDALVKLHANAVIIEEDGKGNYSKYATYENIIKTVRPLMREQDLFFQHISHPAQGGAAVETVIYGHGGWLSSGIVRIPASKQDEHKYGAAITYAKRYSLMLALGLGGDEDPISDLPTEKLPTVVEAQEKAAPKKAPAKRAAPKKATPNTAGTDADKQRSELWQAAGLKTVGTAKEAKELYKLYEKGCRNRKLDPKTEVFESYLENHFDAEGNRIV
jgi:hypothetical protein